MTYFEYLLGQISRPQRNGIGPLLVEIMAMARLQQNGHSAVLELNPVPCIICGSPFRGMGHLADPVAAGRCCDDCNWRSVVPMRITMARAQVNP
jgi:hypothetical protein